MKRLTARTLGIGLSVLKQTSLNHSRCGAFILAGMLLLTSLPVSLANPVQAAPAGSTVNITADQQTYDMARKKYHLKGKVVVKYKDYTITANLADVDTDELGEPKVAHFFQRPHVKHVKPALGEDNVVGDTVRIYLKDDLFGAEGNVESHITTVAADPFHIRSDVQQIDNVKKIVTASGSVRVDHKDSTVYSSNALLRMSEDGKADRVIFTGGARLVQDGSEMTGSRITVEVASGNLYAENNVRTRVARQEPGGPSEVLVYSDYQNYDKASGKMMASGHVKIVYGDYTATGPKATFNLVNGNVDKIFLTGRPTIIEKARRVTADKITITTNPKNFDAVGNVQTQFQTQQKPATAANPSAPASGKTSAFKVAKPAPAKTAPNNLPEDNPLDYQ